MLFSETLGCGIGCDRASSLHLPSITPFLISSDSLAVSAIYPAYSISEISLGGTTLSLVNSSLDFRARLSQLLPIHSIFAHPSVSLNSQQHPLLYQGQTALEVGVRRTLDSMRGTLQR
ncbi:hypothetical protein SCHPADRAFT_263605 [Schizopora paradoxa]|uniref:Uncharacterized protein n=1 Tax=Schizopora paradoxa TaxID=27342 RepID=A0A0H2RV83_9AGAM|nr:hypothetical protein SCHPADRAFT_263605 [Schizopora paradoxa]